MKRRRNTLATDFAAATITGHAVALPLAVAPQSTSTASDFELPFGEIDILSVNHG